MYVYYWNIKTVALFFKDEYFGVAHVEFLFEIPN